MSRYAHIVFPTAVRQPFTYELSDSYQQHPAVGKRVWVPLQKKNAIGLIVGIDSTEPSFNTRPVKKVLDSEPVLSDELLQLTNWIYRFYYCGWGEAVQAALPVGLNFYSEKKLHVTNEKLPNHLDEEEKEISKEIVESGSYSLDEAHKRWGEDIVEKLIGQKVLEVWEEPVTKMKPSMENLWQWSNENSQEKASKLL
ncbi:MAG: hypothetical protein U5J63_05625 [Fodinibius sp.]|nr:hypothetical protein [Fodinibius sp.]